MKRPATFKEAMRAEIRIDAEAQRLKGLLVDFDPEKSAVAQGVEPERIDAMDRDECGVLAATLRSQAVVNLAQADRRAVRETTATAKKWRAEARTKAIPILMLTARGDEPDKVMGLDAGADDYITKPFSTHEMLARIRAVLRRRAPEQVNDSVTIGELVLDAATHRVSWQGQPLKVGPTEYKLLHYFMKHPERVHSRGQLLDKVWGDHVFIEERTVDVHVKRLREALAPVGKSTLIETVRGAGYRLSARPGVEVVGAGGRDPARA